MLRFLVEQKNDWDLCDLYEQAAGSALVKQLQSGFRERGYLVGMTADSVCPYLHLDGSWQQFLASKSQKFRKNLKAARRKLEGVGKLAYVSCQDGDMISELERYAALEDRSWKADKKVGCNRSSRYFGFYRDLAATLGPTKHFQVRFLTLDGEPIAGTFGLLHYQHYYSLQIVHNAAHSKHSPGTLLEALEIEECFDRGYREYDFLGGFLNNKVRWTDEAHHTVELCVFRFTPRLWLLHFTYFVLKPSLKRLLRRWGVASRVVRLRARQKSGVWSAFLAKIRRVVARRGFHAP
jgi:CelD/BcsL family acetyltransferase involved in cellulose biosynthesis